MKNIPNLQYHRCSLCFNYYYFCYYHILCEFFFLFHSFNYSTLLLLSLFSFCKLLQRQQPEHLKTLKSTICAKRGASNIPIISLLHPLIFPLRLASPPPLLGTINHSNQPRSSPKAERAGAGSMKSRRRKRRRRGGGRNGWAECSCSTFKTTTVWTSRGRMALALIFSHAYFTHVAHNWAWQRF